MATSRIETNSLGTVTHMPPEVRCPMIGVCIRVHTANIAACCPAEGSMNE